ncbi:MAG: hypothetical protein H5T64_07760 [Chloroflexi bacterium]|nr:hypothetical protein [Chloroflexota bacterium]
MPKADAIRCPAWRMEKKRIIKDDGRYLIYYRFLPTQPEGDETCQENAIPSKKEKS